VPDPDHPDAVTGDPSTPNTFPNADGGRARRIDTLSGQVAGTPM
jgi:hypothetical protein